jgi:adenosine deaminase
MGLELRDIKQIIMAGFKSSFLPFHVKQEYLRRANAELARFRDDGTIADEAPANSHSSRHERAALPSSAPPALG